jgi:hypothetical protein
MCDGFLAAAGARTPPTVELSASDHGAADEEQDEQDLHLPFQQSTCPSKRIQYMI